MRTHFTIGLAGDFESILNRILEHARQDPRIVYWDRGQWGVALVFAFTPKMALEEKADIERYGVASPTLCVLEIHPQTKTVVVNQECMDQPRSMLAEFVKWILGNFASQVADSDTGKDITALAKESPDELFQ